MAVWIDVVNGGIKIGQGVQQMGVTGEVNVFLQPDDGEGLEAAFSKQAQFRDKAFGNNTVRTVTISGVNYIWLKR